MKQELDNIFLNIKEDCIKLMKEKNINIEDLTFKLGITKDKLIEILSIRNKDIKIYLKMYNTLLEM